MEETDKKPKEWTVRKRKSLLKVDFTISDCPVSLYRRFTEGIATKCNDVYWVRLKELMDKSNAYDAMVRASPTAMNDVVEMPETEKEEKESEFVMTFGGKKKVGEKNE